MSCPPFSLFALTLVITSLYFTWNLLHIFFLMLPEFFRDFSDVAYIFRDSCARSFNGVSSRITWYQTFNTSSSTVWEVKEALCWSSWPKKVVHSVYVLDILFTFHLIVSWGSKLTSLFVLISYYHLPVVYCWKNASSSILRRRRWLQSWNTQLCLVYDCCKLGLFTSAVACTYINKHVCLQHNAWTYWGYLNIIFTLHFTYGESWTYVSIIHW